jgi:hypothetical protein
MELVALGISAVSLVVATVALIQARRAARSSGDREPSASDDPISKAESVVPAEIHVSLERMGHASELVVENMGDISAHEVIVSFDPPSSAGGPTLHEPPFPTAVEAHEVIRVPAVITFSTPPNVRTTVRWSDADGDQERVVVLPTA